MSAKISFYGRLTDTPKFDVEGRGPNCKFDVAVDQYRGPNKDSDTGFYRCNIWTGLYKFMQGTRKGQVVAVWGELFQDRTTNAEGQRQTYYDVTVNQVVTPDNRDRISASGTMDNDNEPDPDEQDDYW